MHSEKEDLLGLVDRLVQTVSKLVFKKNTVRIEPVVNQTGSNRTGLITSYKTSFFKKTSSPFLLSLCASRYSCPCSLRD